MEFIRKKRRGQSAKTQRTWFSEEGYRVYWRKERYGVALTPAYMACVRVTVPNFGQDLHSVPEAERQTAKTAVVWDFVDHKHHLHKKMKTAQEACEKHKRLWTKACEATGIRGLVEIFGKLPTAYPVWARKKLPRKVLEVLTRPPNLVFDDDEEVEACPTPEPTLPAGGEPSRSDPINISPTLFKSTAADNPQESTPVSPAEGVEPSTTRKTRRARSKETEAVEPSPAPPAEAAAKAPKKPAAKPTKTQSRGSTRKPTTTKRSSKSAKKPSPASRKSKSKPSKS
jgi:hypothetical protein